MIAIVFGLLISIHHHYGDDPPAARGRLECAPCPADPRACSCPPYRAPAGERRGARASPPTSRSSFVSVVADDEEENKILRQWKAPGVLVPLTLLSAPYRITAR